MSNGCQRFSSASSMNGSPCCFPQAALTARHMGMRMREHSWYVPFVVTKCYQTAADGLQNNSWKVASSAPNLERKTAQKALFVQEIRPLGTSYSPFRWAARPLLRLFWTHFFGSDESGMWSRGHENGVGRRHFLMPMNRWISRRKRLQPYLQIFASSVANICVWLRIVYSGLSKHL